VSAKSYVPLDSTALSGGRRAALSNFLFEARENERERLREPSCGAVLVLLVAGIGDSMLALEVVEGLVHMLIGSGYELLHGIEGGIVTGAGTWESNALQAVIDFEHLVGDIIMLVAVVVQVVMIVVGSQQGVITPHLVAHGNGHSTGGIMRRLLVPHPQRIDVLLLAYSLLQPELVAGVAQKALRAHQTEGFRIGQDALDLDGLVGGTVHLQAGQLVLLRFGGDRSQLQQGSVLSFAGQLVCLHHSAVVVDAGSLGILVIPGIERLCDLGVWNV